MTTRLMIHSETSSPATDVLTQPSDFRKSSVDLGYEMHLFIMYFFPIKLVIVRFFTPISSTTNKTDLHDIT
jgi:hypothetical protein